MSPLDATLLARAVAGAVGPLLEPVAGLSLLAAVVTIGVMLVGIVVERRDLSALTRTAARSARRPVRIQEPVPAQPARLGHSRI